MLLYIIRHGDPIYDPDSLTEKGKLQAQALSKRLSVHGIDKIFTSPLMRARQTAQPTCDLLNIKPVIEDWTSENDAWVDFSFTDKNGHVNWSFHVQNTIYKTKNAMGEKWYEEYPFSLTKAKEGMKRIKKHSDEFTEKLGYKREGNIYRAIEPNDDRVAVFCHQGFGTTWLSYLLAIPPALFWSSFDIGHSSVTILQFENNPDRMTAPKCITLSDLSHIYAEGLSFQFDNHINL